ncbi:LolA family protein [Succinivibrio faecicola]|uniref:Outer membrane lipoprotein carrier protein LolA n=1 Tax=Succinivibrio faecicola TaxID=2820300 RepID=A0ABS7DFR7_9GAMM|nr:outer membrane lipoprotein carrier protein LolA [Succinivibrio faecicola]MBW7569386.1 outer membrane lipoprotein carrier protein LolA [Succinivibrio faecicola]
MAEIIKIFLFTLLTLCSQTYALTTDEIKNNLIKQSKTEVSYIQKKHLSAANRILESKGYIIMTKNELFYVQKEPFEQCMVISTDRILEVIDGDVSVLTRENNGEVFEISSLLMKIFSFQGNYSDYFSTDVTGDLNNWQVSLIPLDKTMKNIFSKILLKGGKELLKIEIYDTNSDLTELFLSDYRYKDIKDVSGVLKYRAK